MNGCGEEEECECAQGARLSQLEQNKSHSEVLTLRQPEDQWSLLVDGAPEILRGSSTKNTSIAPLIVLYY